MPTIILRAPVLVLVLAATAVPVQLRPFDSASFSWDVGAVDLVANVVGYIPVGMVLARLTVWRAVALAAVMTIAAETCQLLMPYRFPSPIDVAANVTGAAMGWFLARGLRIGMPALPLGVTTARLSVLVALAIIGLKGWSDWGVLSERRVRETLLVNGRGATSPGSLEAHWPFDDLAGSVVSNPSGGALADALRGGAALAGGIHGTAVSLDGERGYVDFGDPISLRLVGSLTVSAWINSASFPTDDAAIISAHVPGYQLDTTIDRGRRTIGFKLVDPCGNVVARYGRTELVLDTWYHVAGVYDADARSLGIYLNGQPDDGVLLGSVPTLQQASNEHVLVGRRPSPRGFGFAGLIDDARIYSRALTQGQIASVLAGDTIEPPPGTVVPALAGEVANERLSGRATICHRPIHSADVLLPGAMVAVGTLSAVAWLGFWPWQGATVLLVALATGSVLLPGAALTLPPHLVWMLPILSLVGAASVLVSRRE